MKTSILLTQKKVHALCLLVITFIIAVNISWQKAAPFALAKTQWKGTLYAPDAVECVLEFTDSNFIAHVNDEVIETSTYQLKGDTIILKKVSGNSPCGNEPGKYTYAVKNNVLILTTAGDACGARSAALSPKGYTKLP